MKVIINEGCEGEEQVIFNVRTMPHGLSSVIDRIQCIGESLLVETSAGIKMHVLLEEIYYLETIENRVFVYLEEGMPYVVRNQRLTELEQKLDAYGFARISKTTLVHLEKVQRFQPAGNGKQRAVLDNEEEVIISRQYTTGILERLNA